MKRRNTVKITPDAFLEAVLDCNGDEACVMERLEVRDKALHAWMGQHVAVVEEARAQLEERGVDTTEALLGWLRYNDQLSAELDVDDNWAHYRDLLIEETVLEAREDLERAKSKTADLVEQLQAQKRARRQPSKRERSVDES